MLEILAILYISFVVFLCLKIIIAAIAFFSMFYHCFIRNTVVCISLGILTFSTLCFAVYNTERRQAKQMTAGDAILLFIPIAKFGGFGGGFNITRTGATYL